MGDNKPLQCERLSPAVLEWRQAPTYPLVVDVGQDSSHQLNEEDEQQQEEILRARKEMSDSRC